MKRIMQAGLLSLAVGVALASPASAAVVNHWTFDETAGLVAADSAGSVTNNATWQDGGQAGLTWVAGQIGGAASLSGSGSSRYFTITNAGNPSIEIEGSNQLSYSFWIQPAITAQDANAGIFQTRNAVVQRDGTQFTGQFWGAGWNLFNTDDRRIRADGTGTVTSSAIYDGTETQPEWVHVAFTWDGTENNNTDLDTHTVYVNGVQDGTVNPNVDLFVSGSWFIGRDTATGTRNYNGLIDDLAVWDVVLTPEEIMDIYTAGLTGVDAVTALAGDVTPGDVTGEGDVNDADFQIIRQNFFTAQTERNQGDIVDNDFVDFRDYGQWKQAPKTPSALAGAANVQVPEPSSVILALASAAALVAVRRRV